MCTLYKYSVNGEISRRTISFHGLMKIELLGKTIKKMKEYIEATIDVKGKRIPLPVDFAQAELVSVALRGMLVACL